MAKLILRDLLPSAPATGGASEKKNTYLIGAEVDQNFLNINYELATRAPIDGPNFSGQVIISDGVLDGVTIGASVPESGRFTTVNGTTGTFSGALSAASGTVTGTLSAGTFSGAHSGDGSALTALNASNLASGTVPAARLTGTYDIAISGNAATVTNGLYSNASYADPAWITSLASTKLTGTVQGARGVTAGSASASFVTYNGTTSATGNFYGGTTAPAGTTRLNYSGYLYSTRYYGDFYGDGANVTSLNASQLTTGTVPAGRMAGTYTIDISGNATTAGTATTAGNVSGVVAIANGGTGGQTAADARTNLGGTATGVGVFTASSAGAAISVLERGAYNREVNGGTLVAGNLYSIWTGAGSIFMNLPSSASTQQGDRILFLNLLYSWSDANSFTVTRVANTFIGNLAENMICTTSSPGFWLVCTHKSGSDSYWTVMAF